MNPDLEDYNTQLSINNQKMEGLLKAMFPDLQVSYDDIYGILTYLEQTQVNAEILPEVIRGIHNLMIGGGEGQLIIHVNSEPDGRTTVRVTILEKRNPVMGKITQEDIRGKIV